MAQPKGGDLVLARETATKRADWLAQVKDVARQFVGALPVSTKPEQVQRAVDRYANAMRIQATRNPDIYACTLQSVAGAVGMSLLTGLMPGGVRAEVYLIPRNNRKLGAKELNWQLGYQGMLRLAERSGDRVEARVVRPPPIPPVEGIKGDYFEWIEGSAPSLVHRPDYYDPRTDFDSIGLAYVRVWRADAPTRFTVVRRQQLIERRQQSESFQKGYGPWVDWPTEMALKTAIRVAFREGLFGADPVVDAVMAYDHADDSVQGASQTTLVGEALGHEPVPVDQQADLRGILLEDPTPEEQAEILAAEQEESHG
jgi:phage RecT family recombinase